MGVLYKSSAEFLVFFQHSQIRIVPFLGDPALLDGKLHGTSGLMSVGAWCEAAVLHLPHHFGEIKRDLFLFKIN